MDVIIRPTKEAAVKLTAQLLADQVRNNPKSVLGLATGGTQVAVYAELVKLYQAGKVDFSQASSFNLDEYVGLSGDNENSYRYYMNDNLFSKVNIPLERTNLPDGLAADENAECARYEAAIAQAGGIDLQLLGIGEDGHIAFNEPITSLVSRTHTQALTPATLKQNSIYFDPPETMPRRAYTMGVGTIMDARKVVMLITGKAKAAIAAKAIEGPISSMVTASALQMHPDAIVILDAEAAAELTLKDYYDWSFTNEPKWKDYQEF